MRVERKEYVGALRAGRKERRVQIGKLTGLHSLCQSKIKHQLCLESQEGTFPDACIATNFSLNENGDIM